MKKILAVPALALVLLVCFVGTSFAATLPYDYRDVSRPSGEDHPWGGEQFEEPAVPLKSNQTRIPIITAVASLDILFITYFEFFYDHPRPVTKSDPVIRNVRVNSDPITYERASEPNVANNGN